VAVSVIAVNAFTLFEDTARAVVVVLPVPYAFGKAENRHKREITKAGRVLLLGIVAVSWPGAEFVT
jgi:hypothetical protein